MIQALERRTLFDAVVSDSPVQDPALATEKEVVYDSPVQDPALAEAESTSSYQMPPPPPPTVRVSPWGGTASENGLKPAIFMISRSSGSGAELPVSFSLGGSAASSGANADYTVSGAERVPGGGYTAKIAPMSTTVALYVTPLHDSGEEPLEDIKLTLQAGQGYTIQQGEGEGNAELVSNKVRLKDEADRLAGTPPAPNEQADVQAQLTNCASPDMAVRQQGSAGLEAAFRQNPALMPYAQGIAPGYGPEAESRCNAAVANVTAELQPFKVTLNATAAETSLAVELGPQGTRHPGADKIRVFVYFEHERIIDRTYTQTGNLYYDLPTTATSLPKTILIPKMAGTTKLHIQQQFRDVNEATGVETIVGPVRYYERETIVSENR